MVALNLSRTTERDESTGDDAMSAVMAKRAASASASVALTLRKPAKQSDNAIIVNAELPMTTTRKSTGAEPFSEIRDLGMRRRANRLELCNFIERLVKYAF